jgi:hypothetical protein
MKADLTTFYVYAHHRATDGAIFYIGKGTKGRAYKTHGRNAHWKRVVAKYGYYVTILADNLTESESFEKEMKFIAEFGKTALCNMTGGGEGMSGHTHSIATKRKQSESAKRVVRSEARTAKLKLMNVGRTASEATRLKMSEARKGYTHSAEAIEKMRQKALVRSVETIAKQVAANIGRKRSEDARRNMAAAQAGKRVECSNGMTFEKLSVAEEWLISVGHAKASKSAISRACKNPRKIAYGFKWQFCGDAGVV